MIIYGWGYFNRRDHHVVRRNCPSCGRFGYQRSYTSSKFATLYFIPLIPLGRTRIVSECPHCKQALGMPYRKWTKLRATELPRLVNEYEQNPADADAARNVLASIITLQDRPALQRVGPQIRHAFARDAGILHLLASTYSFLCVDAEADAIFLEAMGISDDPELAAEANAHLEAQKNAPPAPPNRLLQSLPVLIVPALLLFGVATFLQRAVSGGPSDAYIVNGLDRSYAVRVNGELVSLGPQERVWARSLRFGANTLEPGNDATFLEAATINVEASIFDRVFGDSLVVVNPDRTAVLAWERTGYSTGTVPDSAYQMKAAAGRMLHIYHDVDFPFGEFPSSITASSGSGLHFRTRVFVLEERTLPAVVQVLASNGSSEDLQQYVRARLQTDENEDAIYYAAHVLSGKEFRALAEPHLDVRPVKMAWHRAYQNALEGTADGEQLLQQYRTWAERDPENSALAYLLSRVIDEPAESTAVLERAITLSAPDGYAYYGLAYRKMVEGDFAAARGFCDQALRLRPDVGQFRTLRLDALEGMGDYAAADLDHDGSASDLRSFHQHVYRLGKLGRQREARDEIVAYIRRTVGANPSDAPHRASLTAYLETALALAARDQAAYARSAAAVQQVHFTFEKEMVTGNLDAAVRLSQADPDQIGMLGHLTLHVLLSKAGRETDAARELELAVQELEGSVYHGRRWAGWLRGQQAPDPALAAHECFDMDNHAVFLAALAQKFPANAPAYLERARRMRYRDSIYTLVLGELLDGAGSSEAQGAAIGRPNATGG